MNTYDTPEAYTPEVIDAMLLQLQRSFEHVRPYILENAGNAAFTEKRDGSPVTEIDSEVERIVTHEMASAFPGASVYGEESGYEDSLPPACWLIDPIDGTGSFIENEPFFTCMAVLIINKIAVACIIYNPTTGDAYTAQKDKGAYKNGMRTDLSTKPMPFNAYSRGRFVEALNAILVSKSVACERGPSGAGHAFAAIADGLLAARFQLASHGYPHDYATGALLVSEAGGAIIPIKEVDQPYMLRTFVACHPELEPIIRENISQLLALENELGS